MGFHVKKIKKGRTKERKNRNNMKPLVALFRRKRTSGEIGASLAYSAAKIRNWGYHLSEDSF
jgi:hypothetical protein